MSANRFYSERSREPYKVAAVLAQETGASPAGSPGHQQPERNQARISAVEFYFDSNPTLRRALQLLSDATGHTIRSLRAAREEDIISSDLELQSLRPLLPKLFLCRSIGDGFGAVVGSLVSGMENNRGRPLETAQLETLHRALVRLQQEPFLSFSQAIVMIEEVEHAGFSTEPPGFEHLADWLTV